MAVAANGGQAMIRTREDYCFHHGSYTAQSLTGTYWTPCPSCEAEHRAHEERIAYERAKANETAALPRALERAGIPPRYLDRTIDSFDAAVTAEALLVKAMAQAFVASFGERLTSGRSLLFLGSPGTGKTHLACGIARALLEAHYSVQYSTLLRAVREVKAAWGRRDEAQVVARFTEPDLLILDELGVQHGTAFEQHVIFDVMNERYEHRKPSLLIGNIAEGDLVMALGDRVVDRLREDNTDVAYFTWPSYRGQTLTHGGAI